MKTPEEIAREAAEKLVRVVKPVYLDEPYNLMIGAHKDYTTDSGSFIHEVRDEIVREITPAITTAIEQALTQCPVPSPVSEERLHQIIYEWQGMYRNLTNQPVGAVRTAHEDVDDLIAHIEHLHRMLNSPEGEAIAAAYDQGKRDGYRDGVAAGEEKAKWDAVQPDW